MRTYFMLKRRRADGGSAMVAVLAGFSLIVVVLAGSLSFLSASTKYSRFEQDVDLALKAAEAGVADLLTELRVDGDYFENILLTKNQPTGYCNKGATGGPLEEHDQFRDICGWPEDMMARYQPLGSVPGGSRQGYHYAIIEQSNEYQDLTVVSTGRSGDVYRTIQATMARLTSQRWLYFGNYNLMDPKSAMYYNASPEYGTNNTAPVCGGGWTIGSNDAKYQWEGDRRFKTASNTWQSCWWVARAGELGNGPFHLNDRIVFSGPSKVSHEMTTSKPECQDVDPANPGTFNLCYGIWGSGSVTFTGPAPRWNMRMSMPSVGGADSVSATPFGCRYEGPTRIIFNEDGTMTVWSSRTSEATANPRAAECGSWSALKGASGATVPVPTSEGLIFVDKAEDIAPVEIKGGSIGGPTARELPLGDYPGTSPTAVSQTYQREMRMREPDMVDGMGNVWVEGSMTGGSVTIAADRNIIVTGDLITKNQDTDLIGLLAGENVEMHRPAMEAVTAVEQGGTLVWKAPDPLPVNATATFAPGWPTTYDGGNPYYIKLEAAIYAATGAFTIQEMQFKPRTGSVGVYGAVAENFAGVTCTIEDCAHTGMDFSLTYNPRLATAKPLLFPALGNGSWTVTWQEKKDTPGAAKVPVS
ncbi:MAG: hypothetical protein LBG11_03585 [Bifidobacteriaceae bacterium]|jgi:hypothetical protein|nr:hypothetical protein [Bifidobacteriaceae bacterium]